MAIRTVLGLAGEEWSGHPKLMPWPGQIQSTRPADIPPGGAQPVPAKYPAQYSPVSFWAVSVAVTAGKRHLRLFAPPDLVFLPQMELSAPLSLLEAGPAPWLRRRPLRRSW